MQQHNCIGCLGGHCRMKKLLLALALLLTLAFAKAQAPAEVIVDDEVSTIDNDLDLITLGLPEFEDLEEVTNQPIEDFENSDEDLDADLASDEDDEIDDVDDDSSEDDVEIVTRNQRGKWKRFRGQGRRHRGRWASRRNATEEDGPRGHRHRGRRPWRNQGSIGDEDAEGRQGHHHRHRSHDNDHSGGHRRGRHGRHRHRAGRNRHFRFNATEAKHWEGATWQQKVDHICGKLTRHRTHIQAAQQRAAGRPRKQGRRQRRLEFLSRMENCCSEEQRDSCFYHLRHKVCEERASLQPLRQDLPQPVRQAFSKIKCCSMRGWRRHMCFSVPFSSVHEYLRNQTQESEEVSKEDTAAVLVVADEKKQANDMDVMLGDMPMIQVDNFDDPDEDDDDIDDLPDDDGDDLDDSFDDIDDEDDDEEDETIGHRRPHHGRKGRHGRHQGGQKGGNRRLRRMWKRCCKAGRDEGLGVESEEEASSNCGDAATIYLQNVRPQELCRKAYEKCCIRAATT